MDKLKEFIKKLAPWQWALIGVAVLAGLWAAIRSKGAASATPSQASQFTDSMAANPGGGSQDSSLTAALEEQGRLILSMQAAQEEQGNAFAAAFNSLAGSFSSYQTNTERTIEEVSKSYDTLAKQAANPVIGVPVVQSIVTNETQVETMTLADYEKKKAATAQITGLQKLWQETNKKAQADGKLSEDEKNALTFIHNQANKIGVEAGLGDGGGDGSKRKMVY